LRGPHVNYGFADEMQDWTREAFEVFKEVVNLPPGQIFCAGTPKDKGSFFEELWFSSDKKEWNGKEWIPTNLDADPQISGTTSLRNSQALLRLSSLNINART